VKKGEDEREKGNRTTSKFSQKGVPQQDHQKTVIRCKRGTSSGTRGRKKQAPIDREGRERSATAAQKKKKHASIAKGTVLRKKKGVAGHRKGESDFIGSKKRAILCMGT